MRCDRKRFRGSDPLSIFNFFTALFDQFEIPLVACAEILHHAKYEELGFSKLNIYW